ncbi:MAG TPA: hypothetical protein VGC91_10170 [Pyrinomonadaceae bacterium]|jgi:hypothetical protein
MKQRPLALVRHRFVIQTLTACVLFDFIANFAFNPANRYYTHLNARADLDFAATMAEGEETRR